MTIPSGAFITFEGGEGAGKSTQIRRLALALEAAGASVTITREPGGTPLAEAIRGLILGHEAASEDALTQALLFAAARRDHVLRAIRPALAKGHIVLCDRFADSTRAYQGGRMKPPEMLETVIALGTDRLKPDMTLLLDIAPELGLERARNRLQGEDTFERSNLAFHREVRARFLAMAQAEPARFVTIDASQEESIVADSIRSAVRNRLVAAQSTELR